MNLSVYLITAAEYAVILPGALLCLLPVKQHLRIPAKKLFPIFFPALLLFCFFMAWIDSPERMLPANFFFLPIIGLLTIGYFLIVNLQKLKLLYILLCVTAILSFGGLANHLIQAFLFPTGHSTDSSTIGLIYQWVVSLGIILIFILFLRKSLIWIINYFHIVSVWSIVWIAPALVTLCNIAMVPNDYANIHIGKLWEITLTIEAVLLFLFLLFQIMFFRVAKSTTEKMEAEQKAQILSIEADQYLALKSYLEQTRQIRHDFRQMIHTITALTVNQEYSELLSFIGKYNNESIANPPRLFFCEHPAVNALLGYYAELAQQQQIDTAFRAVLPEKVAVSDVDLCVIVGNILENALHGCMTVPQEKRSISFAIDSANHAGELYIVATNSFDGVVKMQSGKFVSTKENGSGIGIRSVSATCERYGGISDFYAKDNVFYAKVMLNIPDSE